MALRIRRNVSYRSVAETVKSLAALILFCCMSMTMLLAQAPSAPTQLAKVGAGEYHTLLVKTDGSLWSWGYNGWGQLGIGNTVTQWEPQQVTALSGMRKAVGGQYHSAGLKRDGTVWAWGLNNFGQLGNG